MALYDEKTGELITWLKTKSTITNIVGTGTSARIYPRREPQDNTGQSLVFERVSGRQFEHIDGQSGMRRDVLHFYSYGSKASESDSLNEVVQEVFAPSGIPLRETTMGTIVINLIRPMAGWESGEDKSTRSDAPYRYWTMSMFEFYVRT